MTATNTMAMITDHSGADTGTATTTGTTIATITMPGATTGTITGMTAMITMTTMQTDRGTGAAMTTNTDAATIAMSITGIDPASVILIAASMGLPLPRTSGGGSRSDSGPARTTRHQAPESCGATAENALTRQPDNNQALDEFFAAHEDKAFYVAYAALWDREAALDAVQESMLKLVEYYRGKPREDWPALFRTVLNSKINDVRRRRLIEQGRHKLLSLTGLFRDHTDSSGHDTEYELPAAQREDGITDAESGYVATQLRRRINDALAKLSERQRQVFILREWRGMSIRETADTLGCSENSIKQHHFRAMRELRRQLAEVWDYAQATTP